MCASGTDGTDLGALVEVLRTGARGRRRTGVALVALEAGHAFVRALGDADRAAAAQALVDIGPRAVPGLIDALESGTHATRAALLALQAIGDGSAAPAIVRQLCRRGAFVRSRAADALVALGSPAVAHLVAVPADARGLLDVLQALGRIGDPAAIPFLAARLDHPRRHVRAAAARALQALGEAAVVPLIGAVTSRGAGLLESTYALGNIGDARAAGALAALLSHARDDVRHAAVSSLVRLGPAAVPCAAEVILRGESGLVEATSVLARIGDGSAEPALRAALTAPVIEVRRLAAVGFGRLGERSAPAALVAAASATAPPRVRQAAVWALGRCRDTGGADTAIVAASDADPALRRLAARALGGLAPDAPVLVELLADDVPGVRAAAARALQDGPPSSTQALARLLGDEFWHVRCAALDALTAGDWRPATPEQAAVLALADRDWPALGALGAPGMACLIEALSAVDPRLRRAAAEGAAGVGAVGPLLEACSHSRDSVRAGAAQALGAIGDPGVVPALVDRLDDQDPHVRRCAARALNRLGDFTGDRVPPPSLGEVALETAVDYPEILAASPDLGIDGIVAFLARILPVEWADVYTAMNPHAADLSIPPVGGFDYVFDSSSMLVAKGELDRRTAVADRVVAVHGRSRMLHAERDATRMKGAPLGVVELLYPPRERRYDKGHFMGHALGGGTDINLFPQVAATNRGVSDEGRRFRDMERHALARPGTYCFARPLYGGFTYHPLALEFGVLRWDGTLWVERFANVAGDDEARAIERTYREKVFGRRVDW